MSGNGRLHNNQFICTACQIRPVVSSSRDPSHCSGAYPFHCCCQCAVTRGWQAWDTRACAQCRQGFAEPAPSSPHVSTIKGGDATYCQGDVQQEILIGGDATYSAGTHVEQLPGHESSFAHTYSAGRVVDGDDAVSWFLAASQELREHSIDVRGGGEVKTARISCPVALWSSASEVPRPVEAPKDSKLDQRKGKEPVTHHNLARVCPAQPDFTIVPTQVLLCSPKNMSKEAQVCRRKGRHQLLHKSLYTRKFQRQRARHRRRPHRRNQCGWNLHKTCVLARFSPVCLLPYCARCFFTYMEYPDTCVSSLLFHFLITFARE